MHRLDAPRSSTGALNGFAPSAICGKAARALGFGKWDPRDEAVLKRPRSDAFAGGQPLENPKV
jgi:hypothetical protein